MNLTKNEISIMKVLWEEKRPLLSLEIVELCTEKEWKPGSIHILMNSLLAKGAIEVAGFRKTGKHYSRTFKPTISKDDYTVSAALGNAELNDNIIREMMVALVHDESISEETIDILEGIIRKKKAEMDDKTKG